MSRVADDGRMRLGFMPLNDCAPLVAAEAKGFFADEGLDIELVREVSWANIRDKTSAGLLDAAQMLAPLPLAATMRLGDCGEPMVVPMSLSLNGNAVTVSTPHRRGHARGSTRRPSPNGRFRRGRSSG